MLALGCVAECLHRQALIEHALMHSKNHKLYKHTFVCCSGTLLNGHMSGVCLAAAPGTCPRHHARHSQYQGKAACGCVQSCCQHGHLLQWHQYIGHKSLHPHHRCRCFDSAVFGAAKKGPRYPNSSMSRSFVGSMGQRAPQLQQLRVDSHSSFCTFQLGWASTALLVAAAAVDPDAAGLHNQLAPLTDKRQCVCMFTTHACS